MLGFRIPDVNVAPAGRFPRSWACKRRREPVHLGMAIGSTEVGCGVFLPLVGLSWEELLKRARLVEELGFQEPW